jgi:hypothetical protein
MPTRLAVRGRGVLASLIVLAGVLLASGCGVIIEDTKPVADSGRRAALSVSTTELPPYAIAISALDFDPPLSPEALLDSRRPVKLVAAVENKGTMPLSWLTVEARIVNQKGDFSEQDHARIEKLSPGETRVVEFERVAPLPNIPRSPSYRIRVSVDGPDLNSSPKPSRELVVRVSDR